MHLTLVLALPRPHLYTPGPRLQYWRGDDNNLVTTHPHHRTRSCLTPPSLAHPPARNTDVVAITTCTHHRAHSVPPALTLTTPMW
jgi:hypothetical protein